MIKSYRSYNIKAMCFIVYSLVNDTSIRNDASQETDMFSIEDGFPKKPFPNTWRGKDGLYAIGFTKRGLLGTSMDARRIAEDIELISKAKMKHFMDLKCAVLSHSLFSWSKQKLEVHRRENMPTSSGNLYIQSSLNQGN